MGRQMHAVSVGSGNDLEDVLAAQQCFRLPDGWAWHSSFLRQASALARLYGCTAVGSVRRRSGPELPSLSISLGVLLMHTHVRRCTNTSPSERCAPIARWGRSQAAPQLCGSACARPRARALGPVCVSALTSGETSLKLFSGLLGEIVASLVAGSNLVRFRPRIGRLRPTLGEVGQKLAYILPSFGDFGRTWTK